jgi:hypothetical protein
VWDGTWSWPPLGLQLGLKSADSAHPRSHFRDTAAWTPPPQKGNHPAAGCTPSHLRDDENAPQFFTQASSGYAHRLGGSHSEKTSINFSCEKTCFGGL